MDIRDLLTARPIAHRGLHDGNVHCMENSLPAFEAAVNRDFAIELDVQLSADHVAMVFHDESLDRLTGESGLVAERTAAELRSVTLSGTDARGRGRSGGRFRTGRRHVVRQASAVPLPEERLAGTIRSNRRRDRRARPRRA